MLSHRALDRLTRGLRAVSDDDRASELDMPTEVGVSLDVDVLAGRFRLLGALASGGMGVVHRALDLHTGSEVAVKIPNLSSPLMDRRFQVECEALTAVVAPAVVRVLGRGTAEAPFLAMELVRGDTLAHRVSDRGPMTRTAALAVARRVAAALAVVHAAGWIHRDLKPANVTVTEDGDVRLVDFGLARAVDGPGCGTATGNLVGTLSYIAPEQLGGARVVDPRMDVFALGCVLFECLVGRVAFSRKTSEIAEGRWAADLHPELDPTADGVDRDVAQLIRRFASPAPEKRPIDGLAALAELCALDEADAPSTARGVSSTANGSVVRAAALGALRGPVVLVGDPGSGRARAALAAATLVTEMVAPCRTLVLRGNPRTRGPGAHALALEKPLREAGFRNAARALAGAAGPLVDDIEPAAVVVVLDANLCDPASLERIAAAARAGLVRVLATARASTELFAGFTAIEVETGSASPLSDVGPFDRWVLRAGAMFGTVFEAEGAASLIGGPEGARVPASLARMVERGVLRRTADGRYAVVRSTDWYGTLGRLAPRDVRLGVSLASAFERGAASVLPETFWLHEAVSPPLAHERFVE